MRILRKIDTWHRPVAQASVPVESYLHTSWRRCKAAWPVVLLLALALSPGISASGVLAAEPGAGLLNGQLLNGTAGGSVPPGQTITLTSYRDGAEAGASTATSDDSGKFTFDGLLTGAEYTYEIKVTYQEADYTSERFSFSADETERFIALTVYESTSDASAISVAVGHTIIAPGEGGFDVMEYLVFTNPTDRSYIGSGEITATGTRRTLKLPWPDKATDLQYGGDLMSCCVLQEPDGLFDTMAVLPGEKTIIYSYTVKNNSSSYALAREVDFPIASYNLLARGENTRLASSKLVAGEPVNLEGVVYNILSGADLAPGETLDIRLSGLPQDSGRQALMWVLVALGVLGAGGGFTYLVRKKNLQLIGVTDDDEEMKERLLLELAALDDDFEVGKLDSDAYNRRRAEMKSHLVDLMQSSKVRSSAQ